MAALEARLSECLEPLRAEAVGALLAAMAEAIGAGAEVEPEPLLRDADGTVERRGPLDLPERGDLAVIQGGRRLVRRIETEPGAEFEPISLVAEGGFTTVIAPFCWGEAELLVETRQARPDWSALRHWYLDWFQARVADVSPELSGALHRLDGPGQTQRGWRMGIDFGTAPIATVSGLVAAVASSGALRLRIGDLT